MRTQLDQPEVRGLTTEIANLVIATVSLQTDRTFMRGGQAVVADLKRLDDDLVLIQQALPDEATWSAAVTISQHLFGWHGGDYRSADTLTKLAEVATTAADRHRDGVRLLVEELELRGGVVGASSDSNRFRNAKAAADLVGKLANAPTPAEVVEVLAGVVAPTSPAALGKSLVSAVSVAGAIRRRNWPLIISALRIGDAGTGLAGDLRTAFEADELALDLSTELARIEAVATELVTKKPETTKSPPPGPNIVAHGDEVLTTAELSSFVETIRGQMREGQRVRVKWEISKS